MTAPDRPGPAEETWCPECAGQSTVRVLEQTAHISVPCPACSSPAPPPVGEPCPMLDEEMPCPCGPGFRCPGPDEDETAALASPPAVQAGAEDEAVRVGPGSVLHVVGPDRPYRVTGLSTAGHRAELLLETLDGEPW